MNTALLEKNALIAPGSVFIENGTLLPDPLQLDTTANMGNWSQVVGGLGSFELKETFNEYGWKFLYMAGRIHATSFGFDQQEMLNSALTCLLVDVKDAKCNCIEIDDISNRSLLGLPYIRVSAHARRIQKGSQ